MLVVWTNKRRWSFLDARQDGGILLVRSRAGLTYVLDRSSRTLISRSSGRRWRVTEMEAYPSSTPRAMTPDVWAHVLDSLSPMPRYHDAYYVADLLDAGVSEKRLWLAHQQGHIELSRVDLVDGLDMKKLARGIEPVPGATRFDRVRRGLSYAV